MRVKNVLYKSLNVLVVLAMMLVTVPVGGVIAQDTAGPVVDTISAAENRSELGITDFDLWQSIDLVIWTEVPGSYADGFVMVLDPLVEWYYLDTNDVTPSLADGLYPFYLDKTDLPTSFYDDWAVRGVTASATAGTWQAHMYLIITGTEPMFYLKVVGTDYMLVDGLQKDFVGGTDEYLRINGDYTLGAYTFYHPIDGVLGSDADIVVNIVFTDAAFTLSADVSPSSSGTVTLNPAGGIYAGGTTVTLTPVADPGWTFADWTGVDAIDLTDNLNGTWSITMDEDKALTANYTADAYTLAIAVDPSGSGTVSKSPEQTTYAYGDVVTLTPSAATGYSFSNWTGVDVVDLTDNLNGTWSITMDEDKALTANFSQDTYTVTFDANGGSAPDPTTKQVTYDSAYGPLATTSRTGYTFVGWFTAVSSGTQVTATTDVTIAADHTLYAQWTINTYTITASAGTGGSISPSGNVSVNYGNDQSFTITANTGYRIKDVLVDSVSVGAVGTYTFTNVTTNHTIEASFQRIFTLTVNKGSNGKGVVTSDPPGINCTEALTSCSADFDEGVSVTLSASASIGSTFTGWSDPSCTGASCTVTMDQARSVTATFTLNQYTLTVSKVGEGYVSSSPSGIACGSSCEALYDYGTTVTLTPDPGLGYSFKDWTGTHAADLTYNNDGTWSILINGNKSVTANFVTGIVITAYPDFYEMAQGSGSLFVSEGEGVLINDDRPTEVSLYALRIAGSGPAQGELSLDPNGSFTLFNVPSTFVGNLYFNYKACDLATDICSEPATVTIAVKTVPTADPDTYKMGLATTMTVVAPGVLVNDNDGLIAVLEAKVVANPTGGNLTLNANGSFTYTQTAAWMGSDSFTYKACDGTICSAPTTVTIEESDSCLVVDPASLEKTLLPDDTGTLNLTLSNECAVPVDFTLVESGDVVNTPILEEGFENETNPTLPPDFPPDGWELLDTRADRTWKLTQYTIEYPQYVDEGQFAAWVEYSEPGILSDEWLISPVLDISTLTNPVLSFRVSSQTFHKGGTLKIWVTDVNGDPITTFSEEPLWDLLRDVNWPDYAFRTVQVDLGQFNSYDEIRIAWQYVSVDSSVRGASFGMDAVKVGGRSAIPWLSQTPTSGTIDGGKERVITVTFNSSGLNFGRYEGMLFVRNAPYPVINVPVTLIVRAETDFLIYLPLITK